MRTYTEDLIFIYNEIKRNRKKTWYRPDIRIYSITAGYNEIIDREALKKRYKVDGIAVKRINPITRFEIMDI